MVNASTDLGLYAATSYAEGTLGLRQAQRVCCDGATRGGAAAGKFDEVYLVRNAQGEVERIVIIEAKGGKRYVNPISKWGVGRKIVVGGAERYALQGTREYIVDVANVMTNSADAEVRAVGATVLKKANAEAWGEIEYYVVTSKWAGRTGRGIGRGLAQGVADVARVFKAVLD